MLRRVMFALLFFAAPAQAADDAWMNGTGPGPTAPLVTGPLSWSLLADGYIGFSAARPADGWAFPTTTAPRDGALRLNMAAAAVEWTGDRRWLGRLVLAGGDYPAVLTAGDASLAGGLAPLRHVQQAYVGYRLALPWQPVLMAGLFPAFVGLDGYWPQSNWSYTHALPSDFTPYYLSGAAIRAWPRQDLKAEVWAVSGWQTLAPVNGSYGLGSSLNWTPDERVSLAQNILAGRLGADTWRWRTYFNHVVQWRYAERPWPFVEHLAVAAVADIAHESPGAQSPGTVFGGGALHHRVVFDSHWASALRASFYHDPQQLVALVPPAGGQLAPGALTVAELTATVDFSPFPWLLHRLEYRRDVSSIPYVAGPGGVTNASFGGSGDRLVFNSTFRF